MRRVATALLVAFALVCAAASPASAATTYSHLSQFGGTGIAGQPGLFHNTTAPQRLAVHQGSGKLFVADRGNNRVQVFDPSVSGADFAYQVDVPAPVGVAVDQGNGDLYVTHGAVAAVNEVQQVQIAGATAGSYTLTFGGDTTDPLAYNASAAVVQTALRALPSINGANVNVAASGNNRNVTFVGTLAGQDVAQIVAASVDLNPEASVAVATTTQGWPALGHTIRKYNPNLSVNPTAYTPDATFTSPPVGPGTGEIGSLVSGTALAMALGGGIAVDPDSGDILVADVGRNLVQRFDSDGAYISSFNGVSGDRPAFAGIRDLAVTSTGDMVVADRISATRGRIDRFDAGGVLQATLSDNNSPVPNPSVGNADFNWGITVGVNEADEVFVSSVNSAPFTATTPSRVYQFENDVHVHDFAAPANFAGPLYGIVGGDDPARLYVLAANQLPGFFGAAIPRVQVFRAAVPPTVTLGDPSDVQATQATFNGSVNPQGGPTDWRFEYRPVGTSTWTAIPVPNGDAGDGTGSVAVQATVTNLEPNTDYEVRLLAIKGDVTVISEDPPKQFRTASTAPVVDTATASFLGDTSATLAGGVNPRNAQTDYWFEYGLDDNYGEIVPADPVDAGSGSTRTAVTQPIDGLEPDTTYHFRIVAENEFGQESFGDDRTFTTLTTVRGGLGPQRAYEMVADLPIDGQIAISGDTIASENGNGATYITTETGPLIPTDSPLPHKIFRSDRGDDGWAATPIDLPNPAVIHWIFEAALPADFSRSVPITSLSFDPDDQNGVNDLYLRRPDGSLTWISRAEDALIPPPVDPEDEPTTAQTDTATVSHAGVPRMSALSADGRTVVFRSQRRLLESDPNPSGAAARLYKWTDDGTARGKLALVGVRPDGSVPTDVVLGHVGNYSPHAVSRDGKRLFWRDGTTIYANVDGEAKTIAAGNYVDATPSGSHVFYTASGRVHSFEVDSEASRDLTGDAQVQGVSAVSEDGRRVYFVANAQLAADPSPLGHLPSAAGRNLYLVELGEDGVPQRTRFIAALSADDSATWELHFGNRTTGVSPDGSVLAFGSVANLVGKPTGGHRQLYVYDVDAHSLRCGSCPADGSLPAPGRVNANVAPSGGDIVGTNGWGSGHGYRRVVSADGSVFFATPTVLSPDDLNTVRDVYEYRDGDLRLVSRGGADDAATTFEGASVDGRTIFMLTSAGLVDRDYEDGVRKVYAARVGGGFADLAPQPDCVGDACQGPGAPAPDLDVPGSERFSGSGDVSDPRQPAVSSPRLAAVSRAQARSLARGQRIAIRATVPSPGQVAVVLRARLRRGGPLVRIGGAKTRATRAGQVRVRGLRLQPRALRAIRRQGGLRAQVVVQHRGQTSSRALRLARPAGRNVR